MFIVIIYLNKSGPVAINQRSTTIIQHHLIVMTSPYLVVAE